MDRDAMVRLHKILLFSVVVCGLVAVFASNALAQPDFAASNDDKPLSRVREGGTPYDPNQSLVPYSISIPQVLLGGIDRRSAPEYEPIRGVVYKYSTGSWPQVVVDLVAKLTDDPSHDEIAYVVVTNVSQMNSAINAFTNAGADLSKVEFFIQPSESVWMRDYGPHFIFEGGTLAIVDSHYYPNRPLDNFIPTAVGDTNFIVPTRDMGMYYSGGNFQTGPDRTGFVTSLVNLDNPPAAGFNLSLIQNLYQQFQGIDTLHVLPQLPGSVDGTGHIDMWMYLVDEDTVVISEFIPGSNTTAINITNDAVPYMESLGFTVHRTKAWNSGGVHYTYANAFRVNDRIFIPVYGNSIEPGGVSQYNDEDAEALAVWQAAAGPGVEIVPINCYSIIPAAGAIHCIVKQVPRYVDSEPAVHVSVPGGGEKWLPGTVQTIEWSATDTDNENVDSIDIFYSDDNGDDWTLVTNIPSTGFYPWTVPDVATSLARIRLVAHATDGGTSQYISKPFTIRPGTLTQYDFSSGAGTDKFGYGVDTASWTNINGNPLPVASPVSAANLARMATSNATGGDSDTNRYISPTPSNGRETTHVFEFTIQEQVNEIDEIGIHWEGYSDFCTQVELYVWDNVESNWGDGRGLFGQNFYMDNWAGNIDGYLDGRISNDFSRYIDGSGSLRVLIYGERSQNESFHDFMQVTVKQLADETPPTSLAAIHSVLVSGDVSDLAGSDDQYVALNPVAPFGLGGMPHYLEVEATLAEVSDSLNFTIESSGNTVGLQQTIELYNYVTESYELVDTSSLAMSDITVQASASGDVSRFLEDGTNNVKTRIGWVASGIVLVYPWSIEIDKAAWSN